MKIKNAIVAGVVALALGTAQAELIDRGGGLIYDKVLKITWLQNANLAATNTFGVSGIKANGSMTWDQAQAWISAMNATEYQGYGDWRLPFIVDTNSVGCNLANSGTDCGFNVQTLTGNTVFSEMAFMYYVNLGLKPFLDPGGAGRNDWGIFGNGTWNGTDNNSYGENDVGLTKNLQAFAYWSGTERALDPANPISIGAWNFGMNDGFQDTNYKYQDYYAWAVRDGDVVPEPVTLALFGIALAGLGATRRRKPA